jgi:glutaredoxin
MCRRHERAEGNRFGKRLGLACVLGLGIATTALLLARPFLNKTSIAAAEVPAARKVIEVSAALPVSPVQTRAPLVAAPLGNHERPSAAQPFDTSSNRLVPQPSSPQHPAPEPSRPSRPAPTQAEIMRALRATPITMFTTNWCSVCRKARAFMQANGLAYVERDIDADPAAHEELKRRTGKSSIPTIEVDGKMLTPGLNQGRVMREVAQSVERRLGVTGIQVQLR